MPTSTSTRQFRPPKASNAWVLFRAAYGRAGNQLAKDLSQPTVVPPRFDIHEVSKSASVVWAAMSDEEKAPWYRKWQELTEQREEVVSKIQSGECSMRMETAERKGSKGMGKKKRTDSAQVSPPPAAPLPNPPVSGYYAHWVYSPHHNAYYPVVYMMPPGMPYVYPPPSLSGPAPANAVSFTSSAEIDLAQSSTPDIEPRLAPTQAIPMDVHPENGDSCPKAMIQGANGLLLSAALSMEAVELGEDILGLGVFDLDVSINDLDNIVPFQTSVCVHVHVSAK